MQTLLELARDAATQAVRDIIGNVDGADAQLLALLNNDDYFGADQLDVIVQLYGQRIGSRMLLGYIDPNGHANMLPGPDLTTVDEVVWIEYMDDGIGHFSAIDAPGTVPTRDDYIAQYDETHLVFNFSMLAALVSLSQSYFLGVCSRCKFQSFFETQELPECLKGTEVRLQDWSSNANREFDNQSLNPRGNVLTCSQ